MKAFLMYEDQDQPMCRSNTCMNFLTLKKKMFEEEKTMEDFTFCFRFNLLKYRGKAVGHTVVRARTDKHANNLPEERDWSTGFHFELIPRDWTDNGVTTIQTFNRNLMRVLQNNGSYAIWPIYDEQIHANEWNSICFGSNFKARSIFLVRNGVIQHNISQPDLWAELNIGLDTSILQPFKVKGLMILLGCFCANTMLTLIDLIGS